MNVSQLICQRLEENLNPIFVKVINQSEQHANHMSEELPFYGQTHFLIQIRAISLQNITKLEQHRKIFACLSDLMPSPIHALSIEVLSA